MSCRILWNAGGWSWVAAQVAAQSKQIYGVVIRVYLVLFALAACAVLRP